MGLYEALAFLRAQLEKRGASEQEVSTALLAAAQLTAQHMLLVRVAHL